jgi:hypothetical protein
MLDMRMLICDKRIVATSDREGTMGWIELMQLYCQWLGATVLIALALGLLE